MRQHDKRDLLLGNNMLKSVAILLWAVLSTPATAQYLLFAQPSPPPQAAAVGYNTMTRYGFFNASTVDVNKTYASGFQWYKWNFLGNDSNPSMIFNGDASATINTGVSNLGEQWSSTGCSASSGSNCSSWVGAAFGGGAYFEATISFDSSLVINPITNGNPSFWSVPIELLRGFTVPQWVGQAAGYAHYVESDFFEYVSPTSYQTTIHDWYGIFLVTCMTGFCEQNTYTRPNMPPSFSYLNFHTFGALWVPATASTSGSMTWYLDNTQVFQVTWDQFVNQSPPPAAYPPKSWTFGVLDNQHLSIHFGTGINQPMTIGRVRVWQKNSAGNLVQ